MAIQTADVNGYKYGATQTPSVGASPWTFTNPENTQIQVTVSGGTVTAISHAPDGTTFLVVGLLGGQFILNPGHALKITYTIAPTVTYWPL